LDLKKICDDLYCVRYGTGTVNVMVNQEDEMAHKEVSLDDSLGEVMAHWQK
jgi:hypothetical protein